MYNEICKLSQIEAAARLRQLDKENLEKTLAVVDNGMNTLSNRIYSLLNIVSSAIDITQTDLSRLYHGQTQLRSIMQLNWALQTLRSGHIPWKYINGSELFAAFNFSREQETAAKRKARFTLLQVEKLDKLPFTVAESPSTIWLLHGIINLPFSTFRFSRCLKHLAVGRYERLGDSFIKEEWELPFEYRCLNGEQEVFLSGRECETTVRHSMICKQVSLHGLCNAGVANLACFLKGTPVPLIHSVFHVLSNGSYVLLSDDSCCGLRPGIAYAISVTKVVTCCGHVLFPPTREIQVSEMWPHIDTINVNYDKLSRLKALLFQKQVALTSAKETYALQIARSSAEIQSLLNTDFPKHFGELVSRIFNASSTTGIVHFFKAVGSGFVSIFQTVFGVIPSAIHSLFSSVFGGFPIILALIGGLLLLFFLIRGGCFFPATQSNGAAPVNNVVP
ncbi:hypothetical protein NDU88_006819 [Pleurodeles waltl]|uniref:Envelope protein n=1 Tax=Pleurodeles waltl TaxID=8319 RepID=A0AAV7U0J3_PLEWA|nr:hypothetical protein NDU88_006819 [Pleurodeles waltl]